MAGAGAPILGVVGAVIGGVLSWGNPAAIGLGFTIGYAIGGALFPAHPHNVLAEGPRLADLKIQNASYGQPIKWVRGTFRLAGNIIFATDIQEVRTATQGAQVGAKGSPAPTQGTDVTFSYFGTFAIGICKGPVDGVINIFMNGELVYNSVGPTGLAAPYVTFYLGTEDQLPDPVQEVAYGVGNVPAYRGLAYATFSGLPLANFGNAIPQVEFVLAPTTSPTVFAVKDPSGIVSLASSGTLEKRYGVFMVWIRYVSGITGATNIGIGAGEFIFQDPTSTTVVEFYQSSNPGITHDGGIDFTTDLAGVVDYSQWQQHLISYDSVTGQLDWYVNGEAAVTTDQGPGVLDDIEYTNMGIVFSISGGWEYSDAFFAFPTAFFDLSNPANLAKFVTGTGSGARAVDLSADPSAAVGITPEMYLHGTGGVDSSYVKNTGGSLTDMSGGPTLTTAATDPF